ncbi:MAG: electron transfer flavoprotein subunit beta/FixA family protein [Phycisphaerae bacterium]|nr:electron transfer flavoprotein subunit beta/FixA family protein [Phycisphaerae bacterium]
MRIIVPIKQVPETSAVRMDEKTGTMIRDGVEAIVNPLDLYAIEAALLLKASQPEGQCEVIAVSMGPPKAQSAIREAMSMGFDSGVLLSDKKFAGADTWATSYVLAAAIKKLGDVDLIICGERATDGDTGQVGPGIAAWLDLPVGSYVGKIDGLTDGRINVQRLLEDGHEGLEVQLPAVLTVVKEVADPRLPTLRGKQRARKAELTTWNADDLNLPDENLGLNGSPTRVVKIFRPSVTRECEKLIATDDQSINTAADRVLEFLQERELV